MIAGVSRRRLRVDLWVDQKDIGSYAVIQSFQCPFRVFLPFLPYLFRSFQLILIYKEGQNKAQSHLFGI